MLRLGSFLDLGKVGNSSLDIPERNSHIRDRAANSVNANASDVGLLGPLTNSGSIFSACRPGIATLCTLGCALRRLRLAAIPQAVTAASARLGFDAIGQTAKTAGIDELAALVIKDM
jgi:hypothetical protein